MKIHFSICNKCKSFDYKYLTKLLVKKYPSATFDVKCQSYCGPGSMHPFVAVNEVFIDGDSVEELINNVEEHLRGNLC